MIALEVILFAFYCCEKHQSQKQVSGDIVLLGVHLQGTVHYGGNSGQNSSQEPGQKNHEGKLLAGLFHGSLTHFHI